MVPRIQTGFDAIEAQRVTLQKRVTALSEAQLDWKPDASAWNIRQIVEHLVLSDATVGSAKPEGTVPDEAPMFRILPRAVRRALIVGALRRDRVLPLPSPDIVPGGETPIAMLLEQWTQLRSEMQALFQTLQADAPRYSHPVLGPLNAVQMLELAEAHTAYHTRQIQTLQQNPAFPTASFETLRGMGG